MKKRIVSLALALCLGLAAPARAAGPAFSDVPATHWAYSYVERAAEEGWVSGVGNGQFGVDNQVTYAELCTMVVRAFYPELPEHYGGAITKPRYEWYEPYYYGIASMGLDKGTKMEKVDESLPTQTVNRYETAQLLYNVLREEGKAPAYNAASVQAGVGDWAGVPAGYREALTTVVGAGIITGVDDKGTFDGDGSMTRGQAAAVMCRMVDIMEGGGAAAPAEPGAYEDYVLTLSKGELSLKVGETSSFAATVGTGVYATYEWANSNPNVIDVTGPDAAGGNEWEVEALAAGSAVITVTDNNGKSAAITVTVTGGDAPAPDDFVSEVIRLVNEERAGEGLSALQADDALNGAAQVRAGELSTLFDHTRPDGSSCFTALDDAGISYGTAGENIAAGYPTPEAVVEGWMNSEGHRANILNAEFTAIGVGYNSAGRYWVQLFIG